MVRHVLDTDENGVRFLAGALDAVWVNGLLRPPQRTIPQCLRASWGSCALTALSRPANCYILRGHTTPSGLQGPKRNSKMSGRRGGIRFGPPREPHAPSAED